MTLLATMVLRTPRTGITRAQLAEAGLRALRAIPDSTNVRHMRSAVRLALLDAGHPAPSPLAVDSHSGWAWTLGVGTISVSLKRATIDPRWFWDDPEVYTRVDR